MDRAQFVKGALVWIGTSVAAPVSWGSAAEKEPAPSPDCGEALRTATAERDFISNWVTDLLDGVEAKLGPEQRVRLLAYCGRGCFLRHSFKQDIAREGHGDVDRLVEAYRHNFEAWREGNLVHVRYGEVSKGCNCPAAKHRPTRPGDLHCECTRATHQTVFETALGRPIRVEILESVRRGDRTCHFVADVS